MRLGISLRSSFPVADDPRRGIGWMIERTRAARSAGLDSLFVGDGHVTGPAPTYQNTPALARLLAEWGHGAAGMFAVVPLWHPVLLAEQIGTLAAIAGGRFVLQAGLGWGETTFAGMGVASADRRARFEAGLDIVRRLLAGEQVSADGPYPIRDARIAPLPTEPVEVWIAGHAAPALDRAARLGDGWLAGPEATDERARKLIVAYRERCAVHGRNPTAVAIRRDVHVGADDADAAAVADPVLAAGYRGFDPAAVVVGGPQRVAERLAGYAAMGYTDVIVRHLAPEQPDVLASLTRLTEIAAAVRDL